MSSTRVTGETSSPREVSSRGDGEHVALAGGLWPLAWPLLTSLALTLSLNFVDAIFLGAISDRAAGAVGALLPVLGVTIMMFTVVAQAGGSVAGQLLGARRQDAVPGTYLGVVAFNFVLGAVVSLAFVLLRGPIVRLLGLEADMAETAQTFLGIVGGGQVLKALQIGFASIVNSRGQTRWTMAESALSNATNLGLNFAFRYGWLGLPRLGVVGVALATLSSLAVGLSFTMLVLRYRLGVRLPYFSLPRRELASRIRPILQIALPAAFEPVSYQLSQMAINARVVALGPSVLAARVYTYNLFLMSSILWSVAFGIAGQISIAYRVGAGQAAEANQVLHRALAITSAGNLLVCAVLGVGHPLVLERLTDDPAVLAAALPLFFVAPFVELGRAANIVAGGALRAVGDARFNAAFAVGIMWCVGVPLAYGLTTWMDLGLVGIWIAMAADELLRGAVNYARWRYGAWRQEPGARGVALRSAPAEGSTEGG